MAFDTLKELLSKPPILIHPDFNRQFILSCDSSDTALGAMLGHKDAYGIIHPVAYFSKKLNPTQCRYTIMEKELMAIVQAIKSFKHYLYGRKFIIRCDNAALTKLSKLETPGNRVTRWITFLSDFNYTFELIKSADNIVADTLSRDYFTNQSNEKVNVNQTEREHSENNRDVGKQNKNKTQTQNEKGEINLIMQHDVRKFNSQVNHQMGRIENFPIGAGLMNLGNTCYMNVVLQSLTYLPPLANYLLYELYDHDMCHKHKFCMICILKAHIHAVLGKTDWVIKPMRIHGHLLNFDKYLRYDTQEDAHEYLRLIISQLNNSVENHVDRTRKEKPNVIKDIFQGNFRSEIKCINCSHTSITFDPFMDLSLDITQEIKSLEDALGHFVSPEHIRDYACRNCKSQVQCVKRTSISKPPLVATIHFKRVKLAQSGYEKISNFVPYPEKLNFRPYLTKVTGKPSFYHLQAVIVHSGQTVDEGHYYCYIKNACDQWYKMDDDKVQKVEVSEVLCQEAYILIYTKSTDTNITRRQSNIQNCGSHNEHTNDTNKPSSENLLINAIQIDLPTLEDIKHAQRTDTKLANIITILENPLNNPNHAYTDYFLREGLLMHSAFIPRFRKTTNVLQIVIPDKYKPHILAAKHIAHFGLLKTYNAIREKYFWDNLYSDTKNFVKSCKQCNAFKSPKLLPPVPLQRHFIPTRPMQFISCDHLGPFGETNKGNKYILAFIDHFSKYIRLYAVRNQTAQVTAEKFLDFISIFGIPEKLLSDRGSAYTSELFQILCTRLGVVKLTTTPLHPQANGGSEVINKNLKKSLSIFAQNTAQWDNYVDFYSLIYNSNIHSVTNEKPAYLHLGYDPLLPTDILNESKQIERLSYPDFVTKKVSDLHFARDKVIDSLEKAARMQETYQHKTARYRNFQPGQLVYLYAPNHDRNSHLPKRRYFTGPWRIKTKHNKVDFTIIDAINPNSKEIKVHADRLIPYTSRKPQLDLMYSIINEAKPPQPILTPDSVPKKPHAKFDDTDIHDFLFTQPRHTPYNTIGNEGIHSIQTPSLPMDDASPSPSSPDSDTTILYSPPTLPDNKETADSFHRSPYYLRNRVPHLADRLFEWSLKMTE